MPLRVGKAKKYTDPFGLSPVPRQQSKKEVKLDKGFLLVEHWRRVVTVIVA